MEAEEMQLEITDSLGRRWKARQAFEAMDKKILRKLGSPRRDQIDQPIFSTYCSKHFIEHGKHFDPGIHKFSKRKEQALSIGSQVVATLPAAVNAPQIFENNLGIFGKAIVDLGPRLKELNLEELKSLAKLTTEALNSFKQIEQLQLQSMDAYEFDELLDEEQSIGGVKNALSVGDYLLKSGCLSTAKRLAVASWLSECAQDEFDRIADAIAKRHHVRIKVKVVFDDLNWSTATLELEHDRRWIAVTSKPFEFNVIIGMVLGILTERKLIASVVSKEFQHLLQPVNVVKVSTAAVAIAVKSMNDKSQRQS